MISLYSTFVLTSHQSKAEGSQLITLVRDMRRLILSYKRVRETAPLQAYVSALVFSPSRSLTRGLFQTEEPDWIITKPAMEADWSACLTTLEGHSGAVSSVIFSHDSTRLASASDDKTVKIWDATTGACIATLEGHSNIVNSVVFSHDSTRLASASDDETVKIWDATTGACIETLEGHSDRVFSVVFSPDSHRLASASDDRTVQIWDATTGACIATLEGHTKSVNSVVFSHDSTQLASASDDETFKIWDASTGACVGTLVSHGEIVNSVVFSHDSTRLASASYDKTVKIWDGTNGAYIATIEVPIHINTISFDHTDPYLHTDIGTIDLNSLPSLNTAPGAIFQHKFQLFGYGLNTDASWITCNSKNVLWLPQEYRPSASAVDASTVVIGCPSGQVLMFKFSSNPPV